MNTKVRYHLLLCASSKKQLCCKSTQGIKSWERLKNILKNLNLDSPNHPKGMILRSKVDCLRVCKSGPILLIWPDGIWYENVSPKRIDAIITNHLIKGNPIKEWIIKETPLASFTKELRTRTTS
ncbi:(2Fe-2S) ferredoxin domain-containing protein [Prochlorococcus marinus]|uniref:(2Fe-2S) ferredoxin domain-containing protein n=1 Tax=Prochlorococcus marinus TaxID=1219 RepID=UPI0022B2B95D|nr:(2Fe-2S) ferredoxin domain-containing protein [Prochlorococcus marinus]